jgi:predicted nucleic acid-binding protein
VRFLLDTCVLSELVKSAPSENLVNWIEEQEEQELYLSVVTIGELYKGIFKLSPGQRRSRLEQWVSEDLSQRFHGRVFPVDANVAKVWGAILGEAESLGSPLPVIDALIGATASVFGCTVVTRNVVDLERTQVEVLNPW